MLSGVFCALWCKHRYGKVRKDLYEEIMWDTAIEEAVKEAQETMGVEFVYDVDKEAFREATQPMIEAYEEQYPGVKTLMDTIEAAREGE